MSEHPKVNSNTRIIWQAAYMHARGDEELSPTRSEEIAEHVLAFIQHVDAYVTTAIMAELGMEHTDDETA
ncbi:hypothetical protein KAW64_17215 [bacterium]|nr:hypothetical protein [bacterium]